MGPLFAAFGLALVASGLLTFPCRSLARRFGIIDRPNLRSSHCTVTPRAGGLAIVLALFLIVPCLVPLTLAVQLGGLCVAAVAAVSFRDDISSLSFKVRLLVQSLAAAVVVIPLHLPVTSLDLPGWTWACPPWLGFPLAILFVIAYCNFFNFMDGINGLAAGQGTLTGAALAFLLWKCRVRSFDVIAAAASGAATGFLPHNFPAARIFMGDVGSVTLGFLLALLSLAAHALGGVPWTTILLIHSVFLFDAGFTLLKRAWRGENFFLPHREHSYQLLIRSGWSHPRTTLTLWLLSVESCAAGLIYAGSGAAGQWAALLLTAASLTTFAILRIAGWTARNR